MADNGIEDQHAHAIAGLFHALMTSLTSAGISFPQQLLVVKQFEAWNALLPDGPLRKSLDQATAFRKEVLDQVIRG